MIDVQPYIDKLEEAKEEINRMIDRRVDTWFMLMIWKETGNIFYNSSKTNEVIL